jgi:hypothetical protein
MDCRDVAGDSVLRQDALEAAHHAGARRFRRPVQRHPSRLASIPALGFCGLLLARFLCGLLCDLLASRLLLGHRSHSFYDPMQASERVATG